MTMSQEPALQRLIVCVDGGRDWCDRTFGYSNTTNISKIRSLAKEGLCTEPSGRVIDQIVLYHQAIEVNPGIYAKFKSRDTEDQIEFITKDICELLNGPQDEVFFYGSGRGAYIVRAVAGVLHHMGLAKPWSMVRFHENYLNALDLYKARCEEDSTKGLKLMQSLKAQCYDPPQIKFIGVFDTVKEKTDIVLHDLSFNSSTRILRHAVALNENVVDYVDVPVSGDATKRSSIQAWFMGTNDDLCGGTQHDGLSLYPLQWMLYESLQAGLILGLPSDPNERPLALAFPQFAGELPRMDGIEKIEWQSRYLNGLKVSMYDLQPSHASARTKASGTHTVRLKGDSAMSKSSRKVFNTKGLIGWAGKGVASTIIHPSVYCLLDRYPRLQENQRMRAIKKELADFQEQCMERPDSVLPPWLEDMQLQANGVKAFRILVCGKTGVGKSTLINRVFGVEMTEESQSYAQGNHDINQAFESPSHPGLLIHDSRGWQAGSAQELDLIAKFLRYRAFQKDPAEALHVIWFCVDSDVSRIEEADRKTFEIITQFSHQVPVFIVGTKRDKLTAFKKMQLLDQHLENDSGEANDLKKLNQIVSLEAERHVSDQFSQLISELSKIKHYRADGYSCLSKGDDAGIKDLLGQTLGLIADERVRLFCVAAQVVSVEQKINSAITESMRLGTHVVRTAIAPLPCSGIIGTPTMSRLLCEHILQCFGFPKAAPEAVEEIMSRVVMKNLKRYMAVAITQFVVVSGATIGLAVSTLGIGTVLGLSGCVFAAPPAARMLLKCACDMILILERSFRYGGKYVSAKQIEDAARYYTTATVKTFGGKEILLQKRVHDEVEKMISLTDVTLGFRFAKLRVALEDVIYNNRFEKSPLRGRAELSNSRQILEMGGRSLPVEIGCRASFAELEGEPISPPAPSYKSKQSDVVSPSESSVSLEERREVSSNASTHDSTPELDPQSYFELPDNTEAKSTTVSMRWKSNVGRLSSTFSLKKSRTTPTP